MKNFCIICLSSSLFFTSLIRAQKTDSVKEIVIDYNTKSVFLNKTYRNLCVNDWVQLKIINIPDSIEVSGLITFGNKNLELRENFGSLLSFSNANPYLQQTTTNTGIIGEEQKKNQIARSKIDSMSDSVSENEISNIKDSVSASIVNIKILNDISNKKKSNLSSTHSDFKLNEYNMDKVLEIGDATNYLNKRKSMKDSNSLKAIVDVKWQKHLISILQNNLKNKIMKRDALIDELSKKIDDQKASTIRSEKTRIKYFPVIRIDNYDHTEISIETMDIRNRSKDLIELPFRNKKGFKMDFSTGFVFNGLYNEKYQIFAADNSNTVIKQVEKKNKMPFNTGISIMAHAYRRAGGLINMALTTGLSYNLNNQNLNYIFGGSMLLGDDQRLIITGGLTAGKVKELAGYIKPNVLIPNDQITSTTAVPYVDKLKATWLIGVTYNLGINGKSRTVKII